MNPKSYILLKTAAAFAPALILTVLISYLLFVSSVRNEQTIIERMETAKAARQYTTVKNLFQNAEKDCRYLISKFEHQVTKPGIELDSDAQDLLDFTANRQYLDQVRFLDVRGMEKLRINRTRSGNAQIVPKEALQRKSDRYYFAAAVTLGKGYLYVSPMDLNVENGAFERPFKPMIRFAGPVYDADGELHGVVVVNYLAEVLLSVLEENQAADHRYSEVLLLNEDGYWLKSDRPEDEWGFVLEDRKTKTFQSRFPETWDRIQQNPEGNVLTEEGLFTYTTIYPAADIRTGGIARPNAAANGKDAAIRLFPDGRQLNENYVWTLVTWVKPEIYFAHEQKFVRAMLFIDALILGAFLFGSFLLSRSSLKRRLAEREAEIESALNAATARAAKAVSEMTDLKEASTLILAEASGICRSPQGLAVVCNPEMTEVESLYTVAGNRIPCVKCTTALLTALREAARNGESVILDQTDRQHRLERLSPGAPTPKRLALAPARVRENAVGFLTVADSPTPYTDRDLALLQGLAHLFALAVQRHRADEKIRALAHYDQLTGLTNRYLLEDRIHQTVLRAQRNQSRTAFMFIDLDKFKPINDTYGHETGDLVLKCAAERLTQAVRASDTVARIGGDEFVVLIPEVESIEAIGALAERILSGLQAPIEAMGHTLAIGASIGISIYPEDGADAESLKRKADAAMYAVKSSGRNGWKMSTAAA